MAAPPNHAKKTANADDDLQIPIQKTNPLVYVGVVAVVLLFGGIAAFSLLGKDDGKKSNEDIAAAVHSARVKSADDKAKEVAQREHLELAAKAWAVASEEARVTAAASAAAAAEAEAEAEAKVGGGTPGGGTPRPPKPGGPSTNELDELDKLGSEVNSELGGP